MSDKMITAQLADTLLDKLSTDDSFRDQFTRDPAGALKSLGANIDPAQVPAVSSLASKEQIKESRDALRAKPATESTVALPFKFIVRPHSK